MVALGRTRSALDPQHRAAPPELATLAKRCALPMQAVCRTNGCHFLTTLMANIPTWDAKCRRPVRVTRNPLAQMINRGRVGTRRHSAGEHLNLWGVVLNSIKICDTLRASALHAATCLRTTGGLQSACYLRPFFFVLPLFVFHQARSLAGHSMHTHRRAPGVLL